MLVQYQPKHEVRVKPMSSEETKAIDIKVSSILQLSEDNPSKHRFACYYFMRNRIRQYIKLSGSSTLKGFTVWLEGLLGTQNFTHVMNGAEFYRKTHLHPERYRV